MYIVQLKDNIAAHVDAVSRHDPSSHDTSARNASPHSPVAGATAARMLLMESKAKGRLPLSNIAGPGQRPRSSINSRYRAPRNSTASLKRFPSGRISTRVGVGTTRSAGAHEAALSTFDQRANAAPGFDLWWGEPPERMGPNA